MTRGVAGYVRWTEAAANESGPAMCNHDIVLVDVQELIKTHRVWYDFRKVYKVVPDLNGRGFAHKLMKLTGAQTEEYRQAAMWIAGAYKGWLYWSPLHNAKVPYRRVIFDEIHDLVECKADGTVRGFRPKFTLEDAIDPHASSLEALTGV